MLVNMSEVLDAILKEWLRERDHWLPILIDSNMPRPVTLYIGGGTPSLCPVKKLQPVVEQLQQDIHATGTSLAEFTVEANPDDISLQYCRELLEMGVDRLSIGIQSFVDKHLKSMKRRHTGDQAAKAVLIAKQAGFKNISIDLMFGFHNLTVKQWKENLSRATDLGPEHISAYQLSLEPATPWGEHNTLPTQEACLAQYSILQDVLEQHGYQQYEISNFCLPGKESLHNSGYWQRIPYIGLGPSAHSFNGHLRYWNVYSTDQYINGLRKNKPYRRFDRLKPDDVHNEWILLQLRTKDGFSLEGLREREGDPALAAFLRKIKPLKKRDLLVEENGRVLIPPSLYFVSDQIIRESLLP